MKVGIQYPIKIKLDNNKIIDLIAIKYVDEIVIHSPIGCINLNDFQEDLREKIYLEIMRMQNIN